MKVSQADQMEWKRGLQYRGGTFHGRDVLTGTPGTIDNFNLSMGRTDKDFLSPRHRHNFEQLRFGIEGDLKFGADGTLRPGTVGYFPEGAHYGPQTQDTDALAFVLQFGGASGSGYLSRTEVNQGMRELEAFGTFKDGVFRRKEGVEGKRNLDAYQAIWEHINGRKLEYPQPRYPGPIMMDEARFAWVAAGEPGVAVKTLGVFTERRTEAGLLRVDAGATATLPARSIHVCLTGAGTIGAEPMRRFTAVHVGAGETARLTATAQATLIRIILPDLSGLVLGERVARAA